MSFQRAGKTSRSSAVQRKNEREEEQIQQKSIEKHPDPNVQMTREIIQQQTNFSTNNDLQTKLTVGSSGDPFEKEADDTADRVVRKQEINSSNNDTQGTIAKTGFLQTAFDPKLEEPATESIQKKELLQAVLYNETTSEKDVDSEAAEKQRNVQASLFYEQHSNPSGAIQTKDDDKLLLSRFLQAVSDLGTHMKPGDDVVQQKSFAQVMREEDFEQRLLSSKGSGEKMPNETQHQMERSFGTDFDQVRIHTDARSIQMNQQLGSKAFANGKDIYFNHGQFNPNSREGKHLLAHELTHTIQQGGVIRKKEDLQLQNEDTDPVDSYKPVSYLFRFKNSEQLQRVFNGQLYLEPGDQDKNPVPSISDEHGTSYASGAIYVIRQALIVTGHLPQPTTASDIHGTYSIDGPLHNAITEIQDQNGIIPKRSPNAQNGTELDRLFGIIDAQTLRVIDEKVFLKEMTLGPVYDYISDPDKYEGLATMSDFKTYSRRSKAEEKEDQQEHTFLSREITIHGDPFLLEIFAHYDLPFYSSVVETRLTYIGKGYSDKKYYSSIHSGGYADNALFNFFGNSSVPNVVHGPYHTELPIINLPSLNAVEDKPVLDGPSYSFGFQMINFMDGAVPPDNPYGVAPEWSSYKVELTDQLSHDNKWSPKANVHNFWDDTITIVPYLAQKVSEMENDPINSINFDLAGKQNGKASLLIASDYLARLTQEPGNDDQSILKNGVFLDLSGTRAPDLLSRISLLKENPDQIDQLGAGALSQTTARAYELMNGFYEIYPFLDPTIQKGIAPIMRDLVLKLRFAIAFAYDRPDQGLIRLKEAERIARFALEKVQVMTIQDGGVLDSQLNTRAHLFFEIEGHFEGQEVVALVKKELLRAKEKRQSQNDVFFEVEGASIDQSMLSPHGLSQENLVGLIDMMFMDYVHQQLKDAYADSQNVTFPVKYMQEGGRDFLRSLDQRVPIANVLDSVHLGGPYLNHYASYHIGAFYKWASRPEFSKNIQKLSELIQEIGQDNAFWSALTENIIAFLIAEILTLGMATILLIPRLAVGIGAALGTARALKAINTVRQISSVVGFTVISRQLSAGTINESQNSFTKDLFTNLLMIGFLKGSTGLFGKLTKNIGKSSKLYARAGKVLGHHAVALGSLQGFAEVHFLLENGEFMDAEQRELAFISNVGLHTAITTAGYIMSKPYEMLYAKAVPNLLAGEHGVTLAPKFQALSLAKTQLITETKTISNKGWVTKTYVEKMSKYFAQEKELQEALMEKATGAELEAIQKISQTAAVEFMKFNNALQMTLALSGVEVPSATGKSRFTVLGEKRLGINKEDVATVKESITSKTGLDAKWIPLEADKLIKVETADGQIFFIEIESAARTPRQTAIALLGEGKWTSTKEAFYEAAEENDMIIPEELKGSKELNLILQKELLNGWRPGDKMSSKAVESVEKVLFEKQGSSSEKKELSNDKPIIIDDPARLAYSEHWIEDGKVTWVLFDTETGIIFTEYVKASETLGPDMWLRPRNAYIDGVPKKFELIAKGFYWTRESLRLNIEKYESIFGKKPPNLNGSLAESNMINFDKEFILVLKENPTLSAQEAADIAIRKISFGRHRIDAGYGNLRINIIEDTPIIINGRKYNKPYHFQVIANPTK